MDLLRFKLTNILESEFWHFCILQSLLAIGNNDVGDLDVVNKWKGKRLVGKGSWKKQEPKRFKLESPT